MRRCCDALDTTTTAFALTLLLVQYIALMSWCYGNTFANRYELYGSQSAQAHSDKPARRALRSKTVHLRRTGKLQFDFACNSTLLARRRTWRTPTCAQRAHSGSAICRSELTSCTLGDLTESLCRSDSRVARGGRSAAGEAAVRHKHHAEARIPQCNMRTRVLSCTASGDQRQEQTRHEDLAQHPLI